jgi:acyl carrier protein
MSNTTIERLHVLLVTGNTINVNEEIKETQHLEKDLGMDSLDAVEFIMAIEDEFDIVLPDDESEALTTVGSVVELVNKKINE